MGQGRVGVRLRINVHGFPSTMIDPHGFLFDFGGTLVVEPLYDPASGNAALLAAAADTNGVTLEDVEEGAGRMAEDLRPRVEESLLEFPSTAFNRLLFDRLGVRFDHSPFELEMIFWKACCQRMAPAPGIHGLLDLLDARGLPAGVVTNCSFTADVVRWELGRSELADRFRFIVSTAEYGIRKPHPRIFLTAAAMLGVDPEHVWFCGDRVERDVAGALAAGMTAVWYNARSEATDGPKPHLEISHWDELAARL